MDMRISSVRNPYEVYQTQSANNVSRLSRAEEKKDIVALSGQAKDYQVASRALKEVPDVRQDRINEIQSKIESGTYNVSSKDIAAKLMGNLL